MHRRASHAILMHRRGFSTFRRGCVASQSVAGPYGKMCLWRHFLFTKMVKDNKRFDKYDVYFFPFIHKLFPNVNHLYLGQKEKNLEQINYQQNIN